MSKKKKKENTVKEAAVKDLPAAKAFHIPEPFIYIFLFLFAFLLYVNTFHNEYALDDTIVITANQYVHQGFKGIPDLMTKDLFAGMGNGSVKIEGGRFRPLTLITYAIEYQFFGLSPHISHFINVLIYGLIAMLLYRTLKYIMPMPQVALVTTLLFIAHPIHTEVVANIKSRDEMLSFMGIIIMMFYLFKYVRKNKIIYIVFSCIAYFLSLMSKENGIVFIVLIPLLLWFLSSLPAKKIALCSLPFFLVLAGYYFLHSSMVSTMGRIFSNGVLDGPHAYTSYAEKFATIAYTFGKYLSLLVYPNPLSCDYNYNEIPAIGWGSWKAWIPSALYLSMLVYVVAVMLRRLKQGRQNTGSDLQSQSIIAFGILLFIISLLLVSNIVFSIGAPMGERFLFLPSLGFCLALSVLMVKVTGSGVMKHGHLLRLPTAVVLGVILVLFSIKTIARNPDWKNNFTLFSADVHSTPNSAILRYDLGNEFYQKASVEKEAEKKQMYLSKAKDELIRAIEINPEYHPLYYYLGMIYQDEGNADSSIYYLKTAVFLKPSYSEALCVLGFAYGKMKAQYDTAIYYLKTSVMYDDKNERAYENLGLAYYMKGDLENAIPNLERAVELNPNDAGQNMNLSLIYGATGDKVKAQLYYDRAVALDSTLRK